jgi:hypothetical protein
MASGDEVRNALRVDKDVLRESGPPDPGAIPVGPGKKSKAEKKLLGIPERLEELQEALYAEGVGGGKRSHLLVLQGMDTSGKGGTVRHVLGLVNSMGVHYAAFKKPTPAEQRHHFLWRIRAQLPRPGQIGVFDRSHYEDILVPRVQKLLLAAEWCKRYADGVRAGTRRQWDDCGEGVPAHLARGAAPAVEGAADHSLQVVEVQPPQTSMPAHSGLTTKPLIATSC